MKKQLNKVETTLEENAISLESSKAITGTIKDNFETIMNLVREKNTGLLLYELERVGPRLETFLFMLSMLLEESYKKNEELIEVISKLTCGADERE